MVVKCGGTFCWAEREDSNITRRKRPFARTWVVFSINLYYIDCKCSRPRFRHSRFTSTKILHCQFKVQLSALRFVPCRNRFGVDIINMVGTRELIIHAPQYLFVTEATRMLGTPLSVIGRLIELLRWNYTSRGCVRYDLTLVTYIKLITIPRSMCHRRNYIHSFTDVFL